MIPSPLMIVGIALAISLAGNALLGKLWVGAREDVARVQQAYDSFAGQVRTAGEKAADEAKAREMSDKLRKDTADAEHKVTVARLNADIDKLRRDRDSGSGGRIVPEAAPGSSRPDLACYDRTALESALRGLLGEIRGLADEGTAATVDLNTAKKWAVP